MKPTLVVLGNTVTALAVVREAHAIGARGVLIERGTGTAFLSRHPAKVVLPTDASDAAMLDACCRQVSGRTAIIATADSGVRFIDTHREALARAGLDILHAGAAALRTCLDKPAFADWCRAHGFLTPRAWIADDGPRPQDLAPPWLVRPARTLHESQAGKVPKAVEIHSAPELEQLLAKFRAAGVQAVVAESLLGPDVQQLSVPFSRGPRHLNSFVARKLRPPAARCAVGTCVEVIEHPEAGKVGRAVAEALDYFGVGELELLQARGRFYLIEVNARPWLQFALARAAGCDFLAPLLGVTAPLPQKKRRARWLDLHADLFGAFSSSVGVVRRGELGMGAYLKSVAMANVHARFDWRDPRPGLVWPSW